MQINIFMIFIEEVKFIHRNLIQLWNYQSGIVKMINL